MNNGQKDGNYETMRLIWLIYLVGGVPTPLKNMSSSVGIIIPNWMESHHPVLFLKPPTRNGWFPTRQRTGDFQHAGCVELDQGQRVNMSGRVEMLGHGVYSVGQNKNLGIVCLVVI